MTTLTKIPEIIAWIIAPVIMLMLGIDEYKLPPSEIALGAAWQLGYWAFFIILWKITR